MHFIDLQAQQDRIRPQIDAAIKRVLDHGKYIMGPEVGELESQLATFCGAKHAISCSSGTDALWFDGEGVAREMVCWFQALLLQQQPKWCPF